jgi:thiol-disulfide isomerase/thioredoxin
MPGLPKNSICEAVMNRLIVALGVVSLIFCSALAADPPRDAEAILKEYATVKMPSFDGAKREDQAYVRQYMADRTKATAKQNELALEFYRAYPNDERAVDMMVKRWMNMRGEPKALEEMEQFVKDNPNSPKKMDALFLRAMSVINSPRPDLAKGQQYTEEFIQEYPKEERGANLLSMLAMHNHGKREAQLSIYRRIAADYAGTRSAKMAEGSIRREEAVGKPLELEFTDAITGKTVSMKALRGTVVVVDFWATWCGPCVAEMPKMKELYAKYKDQGVEFLGISLDMPGEGLEKLKKYVEENEIGWPQYYQGQGWDSEFSQSWGINGIPALFVIDADGNVHSTEARGGLDSMIPELIKKREQKTE